MNLKGNESTATESNRATTIVSHSRDGNDCLDRKSRQSYVHRFRQLYRCCSTCSSPDAKIDLCHLHFLLHFPTRTFYANSNTRNRRHSRDTVVVIANAVSFAED